MAKITAFSRIQHHGVSDPLSGATIPTSNDHTDGSWAITDIYDRELMVNTGNGNLQYRAGGTIYNVQTNFGEVIKTFTTPIQNWDMTTAAANNVKQFTASTLIGKRIVGMDAMIYPDPTTALFPGYIFKYNTIDPSIPANEPLILEFYDITSGSFQISIPGTGTNFFRAYSDGLDATFADATNPDRGWITITYLE